MKFSKEKLKKMGRSRAAVISHGTHFGGGNQVLDADVQCICINLIQDLPKIIGA